MDETGGSSALPAAIDWIGQALTGSAATILATIALASVGLLMLTGRIALRRGASVVVGCFMIFGAMLIANGLMAVVHQESVPVPTEAASPPPPSYAKAPPAGSPQNPPQNDPYAGAALPQR